MQYEVPQFIEHEAKILGPLTLKQAIYVSVAGGTVFLMRLFKFPMLIFWPTSVIVVGFSLAFAFIKVGGQSFSYFLGNFFKFIIMPKVFVWKQKLPEQKIEIPQIEVIDKPIYVKSEEKLKQENKNRLEQLGRKINIGM